MKNSVLALLMLAMVLSFSLNALAVPSAQSLDGRLKQLIPPGSSGYVAMGMTANGKGCEVGVGPTANGSVEIMVSARSLMGTRHYFFESRSRQITSAVDRGNQIIVDSINRDGVSEQLIVGVAADGKGGRVLTSIEMIEEKNGFFGTSMKSLVHCRVN